MAAVVTVMAVMRMMTMVTVVSMMTSSVVAAVMRAAVLRTPAAVVSGVSTHETPHTAQQSASARAATTVAVRAVATSMVSVATVAVVAVPTVLELALEDVGGYSTRRAAEERAQLTLAHLVAEVATSATTNQRRPEAALAILALGGAVRVVAPPPLLVLGVGVPSTISVWVGRVRSRRRVVGRQVASLLLVRTRGRRRRAVARGADDIRMCGARARVLWMRRVGREVATGLCVLLLRRVRGRRLSVLWLRGVLVWGWIGATRTAAASTIVVVCSRHVVLSFADIRCCRDRRNDRIRVKGMRER